ncbi:hypothetical protein HMPREF1634_08155 [Tissierellia bacterium S7-1-4]|nr:hypothetical protein HMPREF1634_08155 [Tissierellia bacterium S7-1-4]
MMLQTQDVAGRHCVSSRKKSLAPKIFHLSVSHRKFLANWEDVCGFAKLKDRSSWEMLVGDILV